MSDLARYKKLCEDINAYSDSYYNKEISLVSDQEFDKLFQELKLIEQEHPDWVTNDSPTKQVGAEISGNLSTIQHPVKLYSLDNVFSMDALDAFLSKCCKQLHKNDLVYSVEPKFDGLTVVASYENGKLVSLVTRGDGTLGENVTHNAPIIKGLPDTLNEAINLIVKGEVVMTYEGFNSFNIEQADKGLKNYSNPRNGASGLLRRLTNDGVKRLNFYPYDIIENSWSRSSLIMDQETMFKKLYVLGFYSLDDVYLHIKNFTCNGLYEAKQAVVHINDIRNLLPFPIDGAVVKISDFNQRYSLGNTSRAPKGAIAYKFDPDSAISRIVAIDLQVGRLGTLTPVARIEPVTINGAVISNVTLHNEAFIKSLHDLRVGDKVVISRRGDVIPHIETRIYDDDHKNLPIWEMPKTCPSCNGPVEPNQSYYVCINGMNCPDQKLGRIAHYCSKGAMDIRGIAEQTINAFLNNGVINDIIDLYKLEAKDLALPGLKDTSVNNILSSIKSSIGKPLDRFIYALGIESVGSVTAKTLADSFKTFDNFINCNFGSLVSLNKIGEVTANLIINYLKQNHDNIVELAKVVQPKDVIVNKNLPLSGKKVCFTGKFLLSRAMLEDIARSVGAEVSSSISKNVNYLIVGENASSKLRKALDYGIATKDEPWLVSFVKV